MEAVVPDPSMRWAGYMAGEAAQVMQSRTLDGPGTGGDSLAVPQPVQVIDAEAAWRLLTYPSAAGGCSVVVGMHPDEVGSTE